MVTSNRMQITLTFLEKINRKQFVELLNGAATHSQTQQRKYEIHSYTDSVVHFANIFFLLFNVHKFYYIEASLFMRIFFKYSCD